MKLDNAIKTALEYEEGVHEVYLEAMKKAGNAAAQRIYKVLCDEEKGHVLYLQDRLKEWNATGKIKVKNLETSIPARQAIEKRLQELHMTVKAKSGKQSLELELLKKALEVEIKAGNFYKEMVSKLDGEGQELFKRFVEIEEGHEAIVRAEIDAVGNWGFWFDTPEFRLEAE